MTKNSTKSVANTKKVAVESVVAEKSYRTPNCSVNFNVIVDFDGEMKSLKLTKDSSVNNIMLALYKKHGTNLNPNVLAQQIRNFKGDGCKCSANCISWYKNHYRPELNKFVSTKKKGETKQALLDRLYAIDEIKDSPVGQFLPALPVTKLKELVETYEVA